MINDWNVRYSKENDGQTRSKYKYAIYRARVIAESERLSIKFSFTIRGREHCALGIHAIGSKIHD